MKNLSHIFAMVLFCAPLSLVWAAPVATTSGSNLTAFNPSNANNNQWATLSNGRYDGNVSAKADFGNCNAVILRCAQPKCANGGCSDMAVASSIVEGCVKSNKTCEQYGADLVNFMSAQLVASSNAKINQQNAALEQAKIQAEAQAAATANAQSQQQIAAMQQQMQEMQSQMQQQQQESARQLQEALSQQQSQSAAALNEMKTAATNAAMQNEAGISSYQQEAIARGISADTLERQKITGQIMTEIEDAETSLVAIKKVLENTFAYGHCDARGNNCEGPKRVKKWRELARDFVEPYNNAIDKVYEALMIANGAGVDLSQIYMMLDNSCVSWGQYMCPQREDGVVAYGDTSGGQKSSPSVCDKTAYSNCISGCAYQSADEKNDADYMAKCLGNCSKTSLCQPCTMLKMLSGEDAVYEGWVNAEKETDDGNITVVACASGVLDGSKFFASRARRKNGANLIDIEVIDAWLNQVEPNARAKNDNIPTKSDYCYTDSAENKLRTSVLKKTVTPSDMCCKEELNSEHRGCKSGTNDGSDGCSYINPIYAICDVHPYNAGKNEMTADDYKTITNNCTGDARKDDKNVEIAVCDADGSTNKYAHYVCKKGYWRGTDNKCSDEDTSGVHEEERKTALQNARESIRTYEASATNEVKEIVGLKTTVISQQMYKQYEYLNATIRRLKMQLEKAIVKVNLEAAGAESSSKSDLLGSNASSNNDKKVVLAGAENCANVTSGSASVYKCLQSNISVIIANASNNRQKACKQLGYNLGWAATWDIKDIENCSTDSKEALADCSKDHIIDCAQKLNQKIIKTIENDKKDQRNYSGGYFVPASR